MNGMFMGPMLGQVPLAPGAAERLGRPALLGHPSVGEVKEEPPALSPVPKRPWYLRVGTPPMLGQAPFHKGPRWGWYRGAWVRWPDCDPRYDAECPYPTTFIVENPDPPAVMGQGVVAGFGGPAGFAGGPGGLVGGGPPGQMQAVAPGGSPSFAGGGFPCGPAGYGPACAVPLAPSAVLGRGGGGGGARGGGARGMTRMGPRGGEGVVCGPGDYGPGCGYPVMNLGKGPTSHGTAARGRDLWYHPTAPCPPGFFRPAPGAPCVAPRSEEDWGEDYWTYGDLDRYVDATFRK